MVKPIFVPLNGMAKHLTVRDLDRHLKSHGIAAIFDTIDGGVHALQ
jgi:hypothetical protein